VNSVVIEHGYKYTSFPFPFGYTKNYHSRKYPSGGVSYLVPREEITKLDHSILAFEWTKYERLEEIELCKY
jgi:hypothetical protein